MVKKAFLTVLLPLGAAVGLAGCHDDRDIDLNGVDPTGVFEGTITDKVTGVTTSALMILDENANGRMSTGAGTYFQINNASTSGLGFYANLLGYSLSTLFPNGSLITTGTLAGLEGEAGLTANYMLAGNDSGTLTLNYDNVYANPSSLPTLAGTYVTTSGTPVLNLTIGTSGLITGSDSNGCTYAGAFSIVDPGLNAYEEKFTQTCGSAAAVTYFGVSDFVPASTSNTGIVTVAQINLLADDNNGHFLALDLSAGAVPAAPQ